MRNVMKKMRGMVCAFWLAVSQQWVQFRTCDAAWDAPPPDTETTSDDPE